MEMTRNEMMMAKYLEETGEKQINVFEFDMWLLENDLEESDEEVYFFAFVSENNILQQGNLPK